MSKHNRQRRELKRSTKDRQPLDGQEREVANMVAARSHRGGAKNQPHQPKRNPLLATRHRAMKKQEETAHAVICRSEEMAAREILSEGKTPEKIKEAATNALGWASALLTIHDPAKPELACREGCSYCCHVAVSVTIPEILHIADHLRQTRTEEDIEVVKQRCRDHLAATPPDPHDVRHPCPLLEGIGRENGGYAVCSIYDQRPLPCRGFHSPDVTPCREWYEERIEHTIKSWGIDITAIVGIGLEKGLEFHHLESHPVWLPHALLIALEHEAADQYLNGRPIFAPAQSGKPIAEMMRLVAGSE
jgi:Fe-S-cluster containining protein